MAHYAFIDENNIVVEVITGKEENEILDGLSPEEWYSNFRGLRCFRTSYNTIANEHIRGGTPFRKNYASVGYTYDEDKDAFIPPKPYNSWILNEDTFQWEPPVVKPEEIPNELHYKWSENDLNWVIDPVISKTNN